MGSLKLRSRIFLPISIIVIFLCFLDTHLLIPVMALYASDLGAGVGMVGLIIGLYSIINTLANIFFGWLIDRVGYKGPLIIGLLGDALSMFLYSICKLPVHLALVRGFHGLSGGLAGPATMSVTAQHASQTQKAKAMAFYGMALALACLAGYGLGGLLVSRFGYEFLFYFGAAMLLVGMLLTLAMPGARTTTGASIGTLPGQGIKMIGSLFKRRGLIASYCAIFAQYFAFGGVVTLLPLYVKGLGLEAFHVGMMLATFAVVFALFQLPCGALSDKVGRKLPATIGLCLSIISLVMLPMLDTFTSLAIVMALYGTGYALLFPSISALVVDYTAPEERGRATGIFHAMLTAGVATGAPIMGWVAAFTGIEMGLALSSCAAGLALVILLLTLRS